ncbi:MAG: CehA/McbA family metallohydrolase, partial [Acidobacteria bacterium]|nr:CehA/McbA family metallohydrolase [Acidobacteriota bacterium]
MPRDWCVRALVAGTFLLTLVVAQIRESLLDGQAELEVTVENATTGARMPARLYLFRDGRPLRFTPVESMLPLLPDLQYRDHLWKAKPRPVTLEVTYKGESHLMLLDGHATFALPAAEYRIDAYRGLFYRPASEEFRLEAGKRTKITLEMAPWAGSRTAEWLSADDHIHLTRRQEDDDVFLRWIQAEDLSVGNFLQLQRQMDGAVQYAFGRAGEARAPGYSIRPGHESRSFYYGHLNILGPSEMQRPLSVGTEYGNSPEAYPFPLVVFGRGRALGGTVGYAHFNGTAGNSSPHSTFLMDVALGSIDFAEVFQAARLRLDDWYAILNAGFRLTGIAGSDFPVSMGKAGGWPRAIPLLGPERTLVHSKPGASAYENW